MTQKTIRMTERELERHGIIKDLLNSKINGTDASKLIGVSVRQVKRMKANVLVHGAQGLAHKNRDKDSNRKLKPDIIVKVKKLLNEKYYDCGPTLAQEKLDEIDKVRLGVETIRTIMTTMEIWKPRSRKNAGKKHIWRPRKDNYGEMQQFDGSYHKWFGDEETCLLLAVDDATGKITHAKFDKNESTIAVFKFWLEYFNKHGLPISIYLDKFSTYKINHKNAVDNKDMITQFQRAMNQVGVKPITANSPEAKGRVERMNGTLQGRLVVELRLAGVTTIDGANKFLIKYIPKFNTKFAVIPKRRKNLHKDIHKTVEEKLLQIFSIQDTRIVNNDYTVMFKTSFFQLDRIQPTTVYKKDKITVESHLNGSIKLRANDYYLNYTVLPERPKKEINVKLIALTKQKQGSYKPPADHPWRKQFIYGKIRNPQNALTQNN